MRLITRPSIILVTFIVDFIANFQCLSPSPVRQNQENRISVQQFNRPVGQPHKTKFMLAKFGHFACEHCNF